MTDNTTKPTHTTDEWRLVDHGKSIAICAGDSNGTRVICTLKTCWDDEGNAEQRANARLIVATRTMLAALYDAEAFFDDHADVVDGDYGEPAPNKAMSMLINIRAALQKATGATP